MLGGKVCGVAELEVRLFGHPGAFAAGVPLKFAKQTTTLALLAMVVLQRGRPISRTALAFTLFPDDDETAALAQLRRYLYLAHKALPERDDPWLIVDAESVRWNLAAEAFVDVLAFERDVDDPERRAHAIEVYRGDLLEDIYDDWVISEREILRRRYLAALDGAVARARTGRDFAAAIAYAQRALAADPWREDMVRQLLAIRYESGDTAGALADYERFAKRLRDELDVAPMPETVAFRAAILRGDRVPGSLEPAPSHDGVAVAERRPAAVALPFVGRRDELARLRDAWTRAARGQGTFALLVGEAGVGKTRLAGELARIAESEGGRVFVGTTAAPESGPYQAIVEALRSALPVILGRPPAAARRAALARVLPELREEGARETPGQDVSAERETARLFDALADVVRRLASPRPLMLVLEDLHWAGSASVEALGALVRELSTAPLLVIATCRAEEAPADHPVRVLVRTLRTHRHVDELHLERLTRDDVEALVAGVAARAGAAPPSAERLYAYTEGNALFINEAINEQLEKPHASEPARATSIATIIAARTARLSESARAVAEIAAVAGPGCTVELVRDVSNLPSATVAIGFDELLDRRLLREAGARTAHDYVFTHHLIATAIYDDIEPAFRARRHSRIAHFLQARFAASERVAAREIALHFERAELAELAARWYLTSAREAVAVYAYADAIDQTTRALAHDGPVELRRALLEVREYAYGRRADRAGQRADIDALEALAAGDPRAEFDVLGRSVLLARSLGDSAEEGALIARLRACAENLGDAQTAIALQHQATHAGNRSRHAEGVAPAREALALYERLGDVRGQADCLCLLVEFSTNLGDLTASSEYLATMRERASATGDRTFEARALGVAATYALLRQQYRSCFDLTEAELAIKIATNDREGEAVARARLAVTAAWLEKYDTSLSEFEAALRTYDSIGHKRGLATTYTNQALLLIKLGLLDDALEAIERSRVLLDVVNEQRMSVANAVNASLVAVLKGDPRAAKSHAERALLAAEQVGIPLFSAAALSNLGNAEWRLGDFPAAFEHMERGLAIRREIQAPGDFLDDLADLTLAYAAAGESAKALALADEVSAHADGALEGSLWPHYVLWAASEGLRAAGETARAEAMLARARDRLAAFADGIGDARARSALLALPANLTIAGQAR